MTVQLPPAVLINADPELLQQLATPARMAQWQPGEMLAAVITRIDNRNLILQTAGGLLRLPLPVRQSGEPPPALSPKQAVLLTVLATDPLLRLRIEAQPPGAPAIPAALKSLPAVPPVTPAPVQVTRLAPPKAGEAPATAAPDTRAQAVRQLAETLRRALPLLIRPAPANPQWLGRLTELAASVPAVQIEAGTAGPATGAGGGSNGTGSTGTATPAPSATGSRPGQPMTTGSSAGAQPGLPLQANRSDSVASEAALPADQTATARPGAVATASTGTHNSTAPQPPARTQPPATALPAGTRRATAANTPASAMPSLRKSFAAPSMNSAAGTAENTGAQSVRTTASPAPAMPAVLPEATASSTIGRNTGATFVGAAPVEWPLASAEWLPRLLQQLASQWPQASELGDADLELLLRGLLFGKSAQSAEQAGESPALRQWLQHGQTLLLRLAAAAPNQLLPRAATAHTAPATATPLLATTPGMSPAGTSVATGVQTPVPGATVAGATVTGTTLSATTLSAETAANKAAEALTRRERADTDQDASARTGESAPAKLLEELVQLLARAQAQPLQNLRSDLQPQNLLYATLPLRDGDRIDDIEISIREEDSASAEAGRARQHVVRLRFDLPGLGACQFILDMRGDELDMRFYAERDATTQLFDTHVEQLVRELAGENIAVTHVESHCLQQLPSLKPQPASGVDTHV